MREVPQSSDDSIFASAIHMFIRIDGNDIKRVYCTKFLGVHVDSSLNWKTHASQVSLKVSKTLGVLNRVKHILSTNLRKLLYNTLVLPYFTHCNIVWGSASKFATKRLVVLQKRAVRLISKSHYLAHLIT